MFGKTATAKRAIGKLFYELIGDKRTEVIKENEKLIVKYIDEAITLDEFFQLPLNNIMSIISQVNFAEHNSDAVKNGLEKIFDTHQEGIETLSFGDSSPNFVVFTNIGGIPILKGVKKKQDDDDNEEPNKAIDESKYENMKFEFKPITKKPKYFQRDIHDAARYGDLKSIQWLIEKGGVKVDYSDISSTTPLMLACAWYLDHPDISINIIHYLLQKGAKVNAKNKDNETALFFVTTIFVAKTLVEHGADIEAANKDGNTPLMHFAYCGRVDIVKYLLSVGANKNVKNKAGKTAYDLACTYYPRKDKELVKKQLQEILK